MAAVVNAANLWDVLSHKNFSLSPLDGIQLPFNSDRKQHPKHIVLYVHMLNCM